MGYWLLKRSRISSRYAAFILLLLFFGGCGSNYHAETYTINTSQRELVRKVDSFKNEHPEYKHFTMYNGELSEDDGLDYPYGYAMGDSSIVRYGIAFHVASENMIFRCNIMNYDSSNRSTPTYLHFNAVTDTAVRNSYTINTKDLSRKNNERYKKTFEREILDNLGVEWHHKTLRKSCLQ